MMNKKMLPKNVYVIHKNRKYPRVLFIFPDNSRVSFKVRSGLKTAEEIVHQIRRQLDLGTFKLEDYLPEINRKTITLEELGNEYISRRVKEAEKGLLSNKTIQADHDAFSKAYEIFGRDTLIANITEDDVVHFIDTVQQQITIRKGKYSSHSIAAYMRHLRAAFNYAIQRGYTQHNPFRNINSKINVTMDSIRYFTPDQISMLDQWFEQKGKRWYKEAFHFCLSTGIRAESVVTANINNLRVETIEGKAVYFLKVTEKGRAKFSRKTRWVPLLYEAPAILETRREILNDPMAIQKIASEGITRKGLIEKYIQRAEQGFIFFEVSNVDTVTHILSIAKRDLPELGDLNWHSTRHTFALRALEDGIPLEIVSEILGHANIQDTRRMYLQHIPPRSMARSLSWIKSVVLPGE